MKKLSIFILGILLISCVSNNVELPNDDLKIEHVVQQQAENAVKDTTLECIKFKSIQNAEGDDVYIYDYKIVDNKPILLRKTLSKDSGIGIFIALIILAVVSLLVGVAIGSD